MNKRNYKIMGIKGLENAFKQYARLVDLYEDVELTKNEVVKDFYFIRYRFPLSDIVED